MLPQHSWRREQFEGYSTEFTRMKFYEEVEDKLL
jgi:hypothetical protein